MAADSSNNQIQPANPPQGVTIDVSAFTNPDNIARMAEGTGQFVGTVGQAAARGVVGFTTGLIAGLFGNGKKD